MAARNATVAAAADVQLALCACACNNIVDTVNNAVSGHHRNWYRLMKHVSGRSVDAIIARLTHLAHKKQEVQRLKGL